MELDKCVPFVNHLLLALAFVAASALCLLAILKVRQLRSQLAHQESRAPTLFEVSQE